MGEHKRRISVDNSVRLIMSCRSLKESDCIVIVWRSNREHAVRGGNYPLGGPR